MPTRKAFCTFRDTRWSRRSCWWIRGGAVGLGIDTLSVDFGPSRDYEVHRFCASRGIYQLENVANPGQVPPAGAIAVVLPMKLENGSGAPVRIVALVP